MLNLRDFVNRSNFEDPCSPRMSSQWNLLGYSSYLFTVLGIEYTMEGYFWISDGFKCLQYFNNILSATICAEFQPPCRSLLICPPFDPEHHQVIAPRPPQLSH